MRTLLLFLFVFPLLCVGQKSDSLQIREIYDEVLMHGECHQNLKYLCKKIGARLSGSPQADEAIEWGKQVMEGYGFDSVWLQPVEVPVWIRGDVEEAVVVYRDNVMREQDLSICALGGSIATDGVLTAEVIEVQSLEELAELGREVIEGKIVFYNRPFDEKLINTFRAYGGCVDQRSKGAVEAGFFGAVAVLVRSMTNLHDDHPHTGSMHYNDTITKIPAAAISTEDANTLSLYLQLYDNVSVSMELTCETLESKTQYNVVGDIYGTEYPDEVILVGGHLDSWDKGEGAHDDGAGVVQSIEVLRIFKALNLHPKHTIRAVLFINEENGNMGGKTYADWVHENEITHIAAIESDRGGFTPRGFTIEGSDVEVALIQQMAGLFEPYLLHTFEPGYGGVDISPLNDDGYPVVLMGLVPDSQRYFDYHHSDADVWEAVNERELELGAGAMAALVFLIDKYGLNPAE